MQENLVKFAATNPELSISTEKRRNRHPCLTGHYVNGNTKVIGIKNLEVAEINEQVLHLRNQIGRKVKVNSFLLCIYVRFFVIRWLRVTKSK